MATRAGRFTTLLLGLVLVLGIAPGVLADEPDAEPTGLTPPRLSYVEGEASFWRPGDEQWAAAQLNTPLAPGDELSTGHRGNLEVQVGGRAFVRAWGNTRLGLAEQGPDFLRLTVTAGYVAVDARGLAPGQSLEIGSPHAALTIDTPGYYRLDVTPERTSLVARAPGRGTITTAGGATLVLEAGEQVTVDGAAALRSAAPALDVWDTWSQARTDQLIAAASQRHVPPDVYGAADLDQHGAWRTDPSYGTVWVPGGVPAGWAPYSSGRWISDPYYGWTWVDAAPWGWAPYHYGRWVHLDGVWGWTPGPIVARPVYAPALVAFFGAPGVSVTVGSPFVSWVALGWGEPLVPWWGPARFAGRPWWGGWGGQRVVHHVHDVSVYRNVRVRHAVVAVRGDNFGRRAVHEARVRDVDVRRLQPVRGRLPITAERRAVAPGVRPPNDRTRPVVTRRRAADRPDARPPSASPRVESPRPSPSDVDRAGRRGRDSSPGPRAEQARPVPPAVSPRTEPQPPRAVPPVSPPRTQPKPAPSAGQPRRLQPQPSAEQPRRPQPTPSAEQARRPQPTPSAEQPRRLQPTPSAEQPRGPQPQPSAEQARRPQPTPSAEQPRRPQPQPSAEQPRGLQPTPRAEQPPRLQPTPPMRATPAPESRGRGVGAANPRQSVQPQPPARPRSVERSERVTPDRRAPAGRPPAAAGVDRSRAGGNDRPAARPAIERRGTSKPAGEPKGRNGR
jgi:hypothetical protein